MNDRLWETEETDIIVPNDEFLTVIADKTGWDFNIFLEKKDIGNVEKLMNVKANKPNDLKEIPLKRGKSRNAIYNFKSIKERLYQKAILADFIDN